MSNDSFEELGSVIKHFCVDYYLSFNYSGSYESSFELDCHETIDAYNESVQISTLLNDSLAHDCEEHNSTHESEHSSSHSSHHDPQGQYLVLFAGFVLFLGCFFRWLQITYKINLPYTVLLLGLGVVVEVLGEANVPLHDLQEGFEMVREIDPHMILYIFIPGLIFESAFNTNYHIFKTERGQAILLAGPGVIVNLLLIGGTMHYFASFAYNWRWSFCFMFGCILAATDPVAVVALLKELGASKRLSTLIEAESLLNDGTAFVLFEIYREYASSVEGTPFASVIENLVYKAIFGVIFGNMFGYLTSKSLSHVLNNFQIEVTFTLSMCYLAFYFAELIQSSGVLTVVFMGLIVSKNRQSVSPAVEEVMHHFWEMVGFIANTLLFFITGQVIAYKVIGNLSSYGWQDAVILIILYISCHIIRAIAVWHLFPALEAMGYGCTWQDGVVMVYGGLRGAIGLSLALIVDKTDFPEDELRDYDLDKDRVLFHVCGIVFLTLLINATTVSYIVSYLKLNKPPKYTASLFKSSTDYLTDHTYEKLSAMKLDRHYKGANWESVEEIQPNYEELYEELFGMWHDELLASYHYLKSFDDTKRQGMINLTNGAGNGEQGHLDLPQQQHHSHQHHQHHIHHAHHHSHHHPHHHHNDHHNEHQSDNHLDNGQQSSKVNLHSTTTEIEELHEEPHHAKDYSITNASSIAASVMTEAEKETFGENKKELDKRVMQVMKSSYWTQYEKGLISADAVYVLVEAADQAMDVHDVNVHLAVLKQYFTVPSYIEKMHTYKGFGRKLLHRWAAKLLFDNLGFAIELAGGFLYAAKRAQHFAHVLIKNDAVFDEHIESALLQLDNVSKYIQHRLEIVEANYPEVHQCIQTSHAAHALLHHQKHEIEKLANHGIFDEAESMKVMELWDAASHRLFRGELSVTKHSELTDHNILFHSYLCSELSDQEKQLIEHKIVASTWYNEHDIILEAGRRTNQVFVITRGTVDVFPSASERLRQGTLSGLENVFSSVDMNGVTPVYVKHKGECLDIYPILQNKKHVHTFVVSSEQCRGFWLDSNLLRTLKEINIDFWDTLWKVAAVDVIRYYYHDSKIFHNIDFSGLEDLVFHSALRYYEAQDTHSSNQMRVGNGSYLLLLSGSLVSINNATDIVESPAIITSQASIDYIPIEECVGLTLNLRKHRGDALGQGNVKLAKIFGVAGQSSGDLVGDEVLMNEHNERERERRENEKNGHERGHSHVEPLHMDFEEVSSTQMSDDGIGIVATGGYLAQLHGHITTDDSHGANGNEMNETIEAKKKENENGNGNIDGQDYVIDWPIDAIAEAGNNVNKRESHSKKQENEKGKQLATVKEYASDEESEKEMKNENSKMKLELDDIDENSENEQQVDDAFQNTIVLDTPMSPTDTTGTATIITATATAPVIPGTGTRHALKIHARNISDGNDQEDDDDDDGNKKNENENGNDKNENGNNKMEESSSESDDDSQDGIPTQRFRRTHSAQTSGVQTELVDRVHNTKHGKNAKRSGHHTPQSSGGPHAMPKIHDIEPHAHGADGHAARKVGKKIMSARARDRSGTNVDRFGYGIQMSNTLRLDESKLPKRGVNDWESWTKGECLEMMKHILSKHDSLFERIKEFHIQNIAYSTRVKKLEKKMKKFKEHRRSQKLKEQERLLAMARQDMKKHVTNNGNKGNDNIKLAKKLDLHVAKSDNVTTHEHGAASDDTMAMQFVKPKVGIDKNKKENENDNENEMSNEMLNGMKEEKMEQDLNYHSDSSSFGEKFDKFNKKEKNLWARPSVVPHRSRDHITKLLEEARKEAAAATNNNKNKNNNNENDKNKNKNNNNNNNNNNNENNNNNVSGMPAESPGLKHAPVSMPTNNMRVKRGQSHSKRTTHVGHGGYGGYGAARVASPRRNQASLKKRTSRYIKTQMNDDNLHHDTIASQLPSTAANATKLYHQLSGHPGDSLETRVISPSMHNRPTSMQEALSKEITPTPGPK